MPPTSPRTASTALAPTAWPTSTAPCARAWRRGRRLYPAMPYPSYAKLSDDDVRALYAFFMKGVQPAAEANIPSSIPWPLNLRWPIALWNGLFAPTTAYAQKPDQDPLWNRGAYIVQGPGHCGSCHTPRGLAFNESPGRKRRAVSRRGPARWLVRAEPAPGPQHRARALERSRDRAVPQDRAQSPCSGVRLDDRGLQQLHAVHERRRPGRDRPLPQGIARRPSA